MGETGRILIIEDDKDIAGLIGAHLADLGYQVEIAFDGTKGLKKALEETPQLVVLDIMLPGLNGIEICKKIREKKLPVLILMLTLKAEVVDKVVGLEVGADDYMTKPFSVHELTARIRALFRRIQGNAADNSDAHKNIEIGNLQIHPDKRKVFFDGKALELTAKQYDLLYFLAQHPGRPFSRQDLLTYVWEYETSGYEHIIDSHVNRLRSVIEPDPSKPRYVLTVWGVGYRFAEPSELE
jgi:two-component system, OmpR family, alkaline phosphatase synthesis response regulator PhoP